MLKAIFGFTYSAVVLSLVVYAIHLIILIILYVWHKSDEPPPLPNLNQSIVPSVLVQIPLRNERYVVDTILQAVTTIEWPKEKLHIQILDDSDDDTYRNAVSKVVKLQKDGYEISLIHRLNNEGYKAGALSVGLAYTDCDFVAIFDADFIPDSRFLQQTLPYFYENPELAMVQTRWEYENSSDSYVTKCQAMALDAHFVIDHIARNRSKLMMNFNGTAGIWKRSAIEKAGGWQIDTLAEDLDLSYRAQLAGLKCLYLPNIASPSQLPKNVNAFMHQQIRWAKGAAQTLRKLILVIVRSPNLSIWQKMMALLHLSGYFTQFLFLLLVVLSLPMTLLFPVPPAFIHLLGPISFVPLIYYGLSQTALYHRGLLRLRYYPLLALLAMASSFNIILALHEGILQWGGEFKIKPKKGNYGRESIATYEFNETSKIKTPKCTLFLIYTIGTLYIAFTLRTTYYVLPCVLFLIAQMLFYFTVQFDKKKIREK